MFSFPESMGSCNRRHWMLLTAGLTLPSAQADDLRRLAPPSDQKPDPALSTLVTELKKIVASRESSPLLAKMDATFRVEFDGGKGPATFRRHWKPESANSPVWRILEHVLNIPGYRYSNTLYAMPYAFARFPFDLDRLDYVVAIRNAVPLRQEPKSEAKQLATVDYSILPLAHPAQPPVIIPLESYVEVKHPAAGRCFAAAADGYQPAAHRIFFEKRAGKWRWISLAAATTADPPELKLKLAVPG